MTRKNRLSVGEAVYRGVEMNHKRFLENERRRALSVRIRRIAESARGAGERGRIGGEERERGEEYATTMPKILPVGRCREKGGSGIRSRVDRRSNLEEQEKWPTDRRVRCGHNHKKVPSFAGRPRPSVGRSRFHGRVLFSLYLPIVLDEYARPVWMDARSRIFTIFP